jgi:hypothetical protein
LKGGRRRRKNDIFTDFHEGVYIRNRRKKDMTENLLQTDNLAKEILERVKLNPKEVST